MLKTVLGNINITINNEEVNYKTIEINNKGVNYIVDRRYKVIIDNIKDRELETIIECVLDGSKISNLSGYCESGEQLALISFMNENVKLSIGAEDDIIGVKYEYMKNGMRVKISAEAALNHLIFFIAWITMNNKEQQEIYTWFAADPTMDSK